MALPRPPSQATLAGPVAPSAHRPFYGIATRLVAAVCLTAMFACVKIASTRGVHVLESVFYRQLMGLALMIPVAFAGRGLAVLQTTRPWTHATRMVVGLTGMTLNFLSFTLLPIAEATAIGFMVPIVATLLSIILLSEAVGLHRWAAIALGLTGVLIIIQPGDGHIPVTGALVALAGVAVTAWVSILIRKLGETESAVTTMFWFSLSSLVPLGLVMPFVVQAHDPATWGIVALMSVFGAGAQLAITSSLRFAPVSVVLPMDYSSLIWAALIGYLVWDNWPVPATWFGAPLIIGSGLYIVWREHRLSRPPRQIVHPT